MVFPISDDNSDRLAFPVVNVVLIAINGIMQGFQVKFLSNILKISPGGQVMGVPIPPGKEPPEGYRHRLLSKAELMECWDDMKTLAELEGEDS